MGDKCSFAHGEQELRFSKNYKTSICYKYQQGTCMHGEKCKYAHGEQELRKYGENVTYKNPNYLMEN